MVLGAQRHWQVKQVGSGFIIFGSGALQAVLAEGEVLATETGSRVQISLVRAEPSSVPAAVVGIATLVLGVIAFVGWGAGHRSWWIAAIVAAACLVLFAWQSARLGRRVSEEERAAFVGQIVKALRGREVA
jgi:hypothetical protein